MTIYLARHGKDNPNIRGGWSSHGLMPEGAAQAEALAAELARDSLGIARLYSSDLRRAAETAEILARGLELPVEYLPGFREANNGELAGMENGLANARSRGVRPLAGSQGRALSRVWGSAPRSCRRRRPVPPQALHYFPKIPQNTPLWGLGGKVSLSIS